MRIAEVIKALEEIKGKYGNLRVIVWHAEDTTPLQKIYVTERFGREVWPGNPSGLDLDKVDVDEVHLE